MRPSAVLAVLPLVALPGSSQAKRDKPAPLLVPKGDGAWLVDGNYIVKVLPGSRRTELDGVMRSINVSFDRVYWGVFKGFAAALDRDTLETVRNSPNVEFVEQDAFANASYLRVQDNAPWGLGRISHHLRGDMRYVYDESAGRGTCAYILDTGIDDSHPGFNGHATQLWSAFREQWRDGNGHGTHVAGTIGSADYGVAKETWLLGVKVLADDGWGRYSGIIAGMQFVADDSLRRRCSAVVVNMSLSGPWSKAMNLAARGLVVTGAFVGVAAGNNNADARYYSPASEPSVCTVGGTAPDDTSYRDSNWGPAVDILAPAVNVLSLWPGRSYAYLTGTSMATPHVVGLVAYFANYGALVGHSLCSYIRKVAIWNAIAYLPGNTVNRLAYNNAN